MIVSSEIPGSGLCVFNDIQFVVKNRALPRFEGVDAISLICAEDIGGDIMHFVNDNPSPPELLCIS